MNQDDKAVLWEMVRQSNREWSRGNPRGVAPLFDEQVVMVAPGLIAFAEGKEAMLQGYEDYVKSATTEAFDEEAHRVDLFGDVAVVTYRFRVRYLLEGRTHDELGQEVLVFVRR